MTSEKFLEILNDIDCTYVEEAMKFKKRYYVKWIKYSVCAACLFLFVSIVSKGLFGEMNQISSDFNEEYINIATVDIGNRIACYKKISVNQNEIRKIIGSKYQKTNDGEWYYKACENHYLRDFKYLILKRNDGELSLWIFEGFCMENGETYTYGEVMKTIYGVNNASDIISITIRPLNKDATDIEIEEGNHIYTDTDDIRTFYNIVTQIECFGVCEGYQVERNHSRFSYDFPGNGEDTLVNDYGIYSLTIALANGETIDSWKYDVLAGDFYEDGGIFTKPLNDEMVYVLNAIFEIQ